MEWSNLKDIIEWGEKHFKKPNPGMFIHGVQIENCGDGFRFTIYWAYADTSLKLPIYKQKARVNSNGEVIKDE